MIYRLLAPLALALFLVACNGSSDQLAAMRGMDTGNMISLVEAIEIAQNEVPDGFPIGAQLELEDDDEDEPPAFEVLFYVMTQDQLMEVEVDAYTGQVLEVEVEDDGDLEGDVEDDD